MTLNELLELSPEERAKHMANLPELTKMLTPYFPAVRKAMLPPENYKKQGLTDQLVRSLLEKNKTAIEEILRNVK